MPITDSRVRGGVLTLGSGTPVDFSCQPTSVAITPTNTGGEAADVEVLCGEFATDATGAVLGATLDLTAIQDFTAATGTSLIGYSWEHNNETVPFVWQPTGDTDDKWTGEVVVQALTVGGEVGARITSDASWKITALTLPTNLGGGVVIGTTSSATATKSKKAAA